MRKLITLHCRAVILLCCGSLTLMGLISFAGRYSTISQEEAKTVMGNIDMDKKEKKMGCSQERRKNRREWDVE